MSFADEDELDSFFAKDHLLPMITPEAVGDMLLDFPLRPSDDVTLGWLAMALRRALAMSLKNVSDGPSRKSNAKIRSELRKLAKLTGKTWATIFDRSSEADDRLWDHAFHHWSGQNFLVALEDPKFAYNRVQGALAELEWLQSLLVAAAEQTAEQSPNWRLAEERSERIDRGRWLAPIFEKVFGESVTANNWSGSDWTGDALAKAPTNFMEFYRRTVNLAFGERATPDLSGVLKEACRLHRRDAYVLEGLVPGF